MRRIALYFLLIIPCLIYAQNEEIDLESFAEQLFQIQDEDINYEDIYESLLLTYSNKLDLNKLSEEELASLFILNPSQITNFLNYREEYGPIISINELQIIPGFNTEIIRQLKPFVTTKLSSTDNRSFLKRVISEENNYVLLRYSQELRKAEGFLEATDDTTFIYDNEQIVDTLISKPNRYIGSSSKWYGRFRTSKKSDFSLGFTFEKDAGERFEINEDQLGFDFYSYHALLENKLGLDKLILGDYQLQIGQGVVLGAGFNIGKGAETIKVVKRNSTGLLPYTSVLESGFFRGAGLSKQWNNIKLTTFLSKINQDGNIQLDTAFSDFEKHINTIQNTGHHRTEKELNYKDEVRENNIGAVIEFKSSYRLSVGVSSLYTSYSESIEPKSNNYNQFEFHGKDNYITSIYFNYSWQNFTFFGESARSKSGGLGSIGGFIASLSPIIDFSLSLRNYTRDFHSFYGNAFAENSRIINEKGIYWGLALEPNRKHRVNLYYDQFSFPWLKYGTEAPSSGNEWLIRYTFQPKKSILLYIQSRQQHKQITLPEENLNRLYDQIRHHYIINFEYKLYSDFTFRTKIQGSSQVEGDHFTRGFAIIQDFNFNWWKLKFHTRMALFDTDNFDNAQYVYENDVLYSFSIPAYSGLGTRNYVMIRYDPLRKISFWIRYSRFKYPNEKNIGSGLDEIAGNIDDELKMMMSYKL